MATGLPSLAGASWLADPDVRTAFAVLGPDARIVGGAVRDALLGEKVRDIDFGTPMPPDAVVAAAAQAGIRTIPTGIDHGTVTLMIGARSFETTTLREDVETDGRHAVVRYGTDWTADALRRDFTINALSVDASGAVFDPVGGYPDILARRVRFIGDADRRIAEDRLRILRFFRFHARFGSGPPDPEGLAAAGRAREGIRLLSSERVGAEMRKLLMGPRAGDALEAMAGAGILAVVLGAPGDVAAFRRIAAFLAEAGAALEPALGLAALAAREAGDADRLQSQLRLSNAERDLILAALAAERGMSTPPLPRQARALIFRHGAEAFRNGVALAAARTPPSDSALSGWRAAWQIAVDWQPPAFPISGRDVIATGMTAGPQVGAVLDQLRNWWIGEDFRPDPEALRRRLHALVAAQQ